MAQVNTNMYSLNAQRNLAKNSLGLSSAIERLSSGLRVNSARDDASGLATGMTIDAAARSTAASIRNDSDTISANQIADGALQVVGDIVTRIIELQAQGQSTGAGSEAALLATQATTIQNDAIAKGGTASILAVTVSATATTTDLGTVATNRTTAGANMNNAQFSIQAKQVSYENQLARRSRIMDADFAVETSNLSRFQVLQQAGTAMIAQANAIPQNVLTLLR